MVALPAALSAGAVGMAFLLAYFGEGPALGLACWVALLLAVLSGLVLPPLGAAKLVAQPDRRGRRLHRLEAAFFCALGWAINFGVVWASAAVATRVVRLPGIC